MDDAVTVVVIFDEIIFPLRPRQARSKTPVMT